MVPSNVHDAPDAGSGLFEGGPPRRLKKWTGLHGHTVRTAALAAGISWLPLAILSAAQSLFGDQGTFRSFGLDFSVHARCLITMPLLIIAEVVIVPRLQWIAQHFLDSDLVTSRDRPRFDSAVASTQRLRDSPLVEAGVITLAASLLVVLALSLPLSHVPLWQRPTGGIFPHYSPAGWWHLLVSQMLLLLLFLGWTWRLVLWTRFLWLMSRLDLQLVPAHPDRAAGLRFVSASLRACSILGCAMGALVAGTVANGVFHEGTPPLAYKGSAIGAVIVVVVLFSGPLLVFSGQLLEQWRRGLFTYGALAVEIGQRFERKWFPRLGGIDDETLEAPDFSATTDLYAVVANVYQMHIVPMELRNLLPLVAATLLPFLPVLLMAVPLDTLLENLAQLLF